MPKLPEKLTDRMHGSKMRSFFVFWRRSFFHKLILTQYISGCGDYSREDVFWLESDGFAAVHVDFNLICSQWVLIQFKIV